MSERLCAALTKATLGVKKGRRTAALEFISRLDATGAAAFPDALERPGATQSSLGHALARIGEAASFQEIAFADVFVASPFDAFDGAESGQSSLHESSVALERVRLKAEEKDGVRSVRLRMIVRLGGQEAQSWAAQHIGEFVWLKLKP